MKTNGSTTSGLDHAIKDICSRLLLHSKADNRRKKFFQWNEKHRNKMGPERFKEEKRASSNQNIPSL